MYITPPLHRMNIKRLVLQLCTVLGFHFSLKWYRIVPNFSIPFRVIIGLKIFAFLCSFQTPRIPHLLRSISHPSSVAFIRKQVDYDYALDFRHFKYLLLHQKFFHFLICLPISSSFYGI